MSAQLRCAERERSTVVIFDERRRKKGIIMCVTDKCKISSLYDVDKMAEVE